MEIVDPGFRGGTRPRYSADIEEAFSVLDMDAIGDYVDAIFFFGMGK